MLDLSNISGKGRACSTPTNPLICTRISSTICHMSDGLIARRYSVDVRLKVSACLLFALSLSVDLCAQTSTGSVLGEVTDQSGSAVAGAAVTLESIDTGQKREAVTNELGQYDFPLLLPGPYKLTAKKQGF